MWDNRGVDADVVRQVYFNLVAHGTSITQSLRELGVARRTFYAWREREPAKFAAAEREGRAAAQRILQEQREMRRRLREKTEELVEVTIFPALETLVTQLIEDAMNTESPRLRLSILRELAKLAREGLSPPASSAAEIPQLPASAGPPRLPQPDLARGIAFGQISRVEVETVRGDCLEYRRGDPLEGEAEEL